MKKLDLTLYLVSNSEKTSEEVFLRKIESALQAGVTLLQLREKEKEGKELYKLGLKVNQLAKKYNVPLIIDDRVDIAMAVDAAGVHLGQSDLPIDVARKLLGKEKIIGATAKTKRQALKAEKQGADYLGVGAIYPTTTKVKTVITSVDTLKEICNAVNIPAIAIGGLNINNLNVLKNTGINGISVVSAIMESDNINNTVKDLKNAVLEVI